MIQIRALVFDIFGTVVDWRNGIAREAAPFLTKCGRSDIDPISFADAWRERYQPSMEEIRSGRRPYCRLDVLHRENLAYVLQYFGIDTASVSEPDIVALNRAWHRLDAWPDVEAALNRLKPHFILGPLSNGNISMMVNLARHARLPWEVVLGAEVTQAYKPSPQAYLRAVEALDLPHAEVCLVAAHNGDLRAARSCGLSTAFVPRPDEYGSHEKADLKADSEWDVIATDFTDLADQLLASRAGAAR